MRRTNHTGMLLSLFSTTLLSFFAVARPQSRRCSSAASVVAVFALFGFVSLFPTHANAAYIELPYEVISQDSTKTTIEVDATTLFANAPTGLRADANFTTIKEYDNVNSSNHCSTQNGGATGTSDTFFAEIVYSYHVDDGQVDCSQPGTYYLVYAVNYPNSVFECTTKDCYYVEYEWNGTSVVNNPEQPVNFDASLYYGIFDTRLITASSSGSRLTPTISLEYFLNPDEYTFNNTPDSVSINVWKDSTQDVFLGTDTPIILSYVSGTSTRAFTYSRALEANSTYRVNITFYNKIQNTVVFPRTSIEMTITTNNSNIASYVVNNVSNGLTFTQTDYEDCGITALSGCFNNSARFLFLPDAESISQFQVTYSELWDKAPFIYLSQIPALITSLFGQSGGTFSIGIDTGLGEFTFFNSTSVANVPNANTIKDIGSAFLWLSFAFMIYRKTLAIHDKTTV